MLKLILAGALLLVAPSAQAATIKWVSGSPIGCTMKISGIIELGDAEHLKTFLLDRNPFGERICFNSPGGSYLAGIRIAETIYETGHMVPTGVDAGDHCESACFLAFMAGSHPRREDVSAVPDRVMHPTSRAGFHSPSLDMPEGDYSEAELAEAYQKALLSVAELIALREAHDTYSFRDRLLDRMLRVPPHEMQYVETVGDAALYGIVVYPVAMPSRFSATHALQACRALGRMSEEFDMSDENHPPPPEVSGTDAAVSVSAFFNWGESPSRCSIVYPLDGQPSGLSGDFVPVWSFGQARVDDERIGGDAFEIAAYMHYPFETEIRDLPLGSHPASTDPSRIRALSRAQ